MFLQKHTNNNQQLLIIPVMLVLFILALLFIYNLQAVRPSVTTIQQTVVTPDTPATDPQESAPLFETGSIL